ncbi:MAG: hypothetical protein QM648_04425 [Solirubrobacterales bacterium]
MARRSITIMITTLGAVLAMSASAGAVTIGSLAPPVVDNGGCGSCNQFQITTDPSSPSYEVPFDGLITSFSIRTGTITAADKISLMLTYQKTNTSYALKYISPPLAIPASSANGVATFALSVPVTAGWSLGLWGNTTTTPLSYIPSSFIAADTTGSYAILPAVGSTGGLQGSATSGHRINVTANVEHDADGDGFGDESQDCFPADPTRHGDCPDVTAPLISKLSSKNAKFKVSAKGAAIGKSTPKGTSLRVTLSEAASVKFVVQNAAKKKGRTIWRKVHSFSRQMAAGATSISYSGRYKSGKKAKSLRAGSYRVIATPTDRAGNKGPAKTARFTVVS